jgi:hypothetical protein
MLLLAWGLSAGCETRPETRSLANTAIAPSARNNAYSLLHQLFGEQKDVSLLRFIRPENTALKDFTKLVAADSKAGEKELEDFARQDPSIHLDTTWLPPGEALTRDAIARMKEHALLTQKGREFDLTLLLSQTEALNYAWHLADVAAQYEPDPDRAKALRDLATEMETLYRQAFNMLLEAQK